MTAIANAKQSSGNAFPEGIIYCVWQISHEWLLLEYWIEFMLLALATQQQVFSCI